MKSSTSAPFRLTGSNVRVTDSAGGMISILVNDCSEKAWGTYRSHIAGLSMWLNDQFAE